ncbi:hypothetical protein [Amycolatopsis sp. NPDC051372]|uniref:hypothetical protein n=1 Tax=Amycolatopsis sp. NPDC051372 TaxID=3155669 RepID=UPI0034294A7A
MLTKARQVGSAAVVAILVTVLASAPSGSLVGYHRGFLFMAIACFAATITVVATNPRTR